MEKKYESSGVVAPMGGGTNICHPMSRKQCFPFYSAFRHSLHVLSELRLYVRY